MAASVDVRELALRGGEGVEPMGDEGDESDTDAEQESDGDEAISEDT